MFVRNVEEKPVERLVFTLVRFKCVLPRYIYIYMGKWFDRGWDKTGVLCNTSPNIGLLVKKKNQC